VHIAKQKPVRRSVSVMLKKTLKYIFFKFFALPLPTRLVSIAPKRRLVAVDLRIYM